MPSDAAETPGPYPSTAADFPAWRARRIAANGAKLAAANAALDAEAERLWRADAALMPPLDGGAAYADEPAGTRSAYRTRAVASLAEKARRGG